MLGQLSMNTDKLSKTQLADKVAAMNPSSFVMNQMI